MVGLWRRWRQRPARSATPFSFLCLYPRGRLLARLISGPRPALCPPPLPRRVAPNRGCSAEARVPRSPRSGGLEPSSAARAQPGPGTVWVSGPCRRAPDCPSSRPPGPGTYPAALSAPPAAGLLLCSFSESAPRRGWAPSPPSGAGGAAVAASRERDP